MTSGRVAPSVVIDAFATSARRHQRRAIVAIDVIRATTLAITAIAEGRRCLVARDVDDALAIREELGDALLVGEIAGDRPEPFDMNNSPAQLAERTDVDRPVVMVSSSGAGLMLEAERWGAAAYVACLRNVSASAAHLIEHEASVALIGAGSRGEFREEDQLCCGWIGARLVDAGFTADERTRSIVDRWRDASVLDAEVSNSVQYLRQSGQVRDFEFTASHIDDLDVVAAMRGNDVERVHSDIAAGVNGRA